MWCAPRPRIFFVRFSGVFVPPCVCVYHAYDGFPCTSVRLLDPVNTNNTPSVSFFLRLGMCVCVCVPAYRAGVCDTLRQCFEETVGVGGANICRFR